MKKLAITGALLAAALLLFLTVKHLRSNDGAEYRFVELTRGDVKTVVSSTGTLQATTTVQVGTQVSGEVGGVTSVDDPGFAQLMQQIVIALFPTRDPQRDREQPILIP